jgi:hypothetical protein
MWSWSSILWKDQFQEDEMYGHVARTLKRGDPAGNRPVVLSRFKWEDNVGRCLRDIKWDDFDWGELVQKMDHLWNTALNFQVPQNDGTILQRLSKRRLDEMGSAQGVTRGVVVGIKKFASCLWHEFRRHTVQVLAQWRHSFEAEVLLIPVQNATNSGWGSSDSPARRILWCWGSS